MNKLIYMLVLLVSTSGFSANKYAKFSKVNSCKQSMEPKKEVIKKDMDQLDPSLDSARVYEKWGIVRQYPEKVLEETRALIKRSIQSSDLIGRADYRKLKFITIDNADTIDRDDAIHVSYHNGVYKIRVAVPHMSYFIKPGSAIYDWVTTQFTSNYLREEVIHMLPHDLVSGLLSIDPNKDRLAMVYEIDYMPGLNKFSNFTVVQAIVNSKKAYSYEEFERKIIHENERETHEHHAIELYKILNSKRKAIQFPFETESNAVFDSQGKLLGFEPHKSLTANHLIEVYMVTINSHGGNFMAKHNIPGVYRGQEESSESRVKKFFDVLNRLGLRVEFKPELSMAQNLESAFQKAKKYEHPKALVPALFYITANAENTIFPTSHFYLNVDPYAFHTSPIRRFADFWNQMMYDRYLDGTLESADTIRLISTQDNLVSADNDKMYAAKRSEYQWESIKRMRLSDIKVGLAYNGIIAREFPEFDLVYIPEKDMYGYSYREFSEMTKNPLHRTGEKVMFQVKELDLEEGQVVGEIYR